MKKHLLALAVASALPAAASAQAVTVYGVLDTSVVSAKDGAVSQTFVSSGANLTSRLGFRGVEDLGGGLKAFFVLEGAMGTDRGKLGTDAGAVTNIRTVIVTAGPGTIAVTDTSRDTNNSIFDRAAVVGLEGGFGRLQFGKMKHEAANIQDLYNVTGANVGNLPAGILAVAIADSGRINNAIEYRTPTFSGFTAKFQHSAGRQTESVTAGSTAVGRVQNVQLTYANGPLLFVATQSREKETVSEDITDTGFAATYDLGFAKVGVASLRSDRDNSAADERRSGTQFTVNAPLGNGLSLWGAINRVKTDADNDKATHAMVGLSKDLSKRTTLFGVYNQVKNDAGADFTASGLPAASAAGEDPKGVILGITHRF